MSNTVYGQLNHLHHHGHFRAVGVMISV